MIRLTRRYRFSASHRLHTERLSEKENALVYGRCNNPHGHGHDYVLEVSVRGEIDPASGRAADLAKLDRVVHEHVLAPFNRRYLNFDAPEFARMVPTTENLVLAIRTRLARAWKAAFPGPWPTLERIKVHETRRNSCEAAGHEPAPQTI